MRVRNVIDKENKYRTVVWFASKGINPLLCTSIIIDFFTSDNNVYEYRLTAVNNSNTNFADTEGRTAVVDYNTKTLTLTYKISTTETASNTFNFDNINNTMTDDASNISIIENNGIITLSSTTDKINDTDGIISLTNIENTFLQLNNSIITLSNVYAYSDADTVAMSGLFNIMHLKQSAIAYSNDADAVVQYLSQHLSIMKNELWYNYLYGLPLLQKDVTKAIIDSEAISIIYSDPDVIELISYDSEVVYDATISGYEYSASFKLQTKYGDVFVTI